MEGPDDIAEPELLRMIVAGDRPAFNLLAKAHAPRLLGLAGRMLGSPEDAQDAVQDALAATWVGRHRLDSNRPAAAFLTTVTLNKCRDRLRRKKAARFLGFGAGQDGDYRPDPSPDAETSLIDADLLARVYRELEHLPLRLREALVLVALDGRSQREAASLLGVSEKAVETRIYRARQKIREKIPDL